MKKLKLVMALCMVMLIAAMSGCDSKKNDNNSPVMANDALLLGKDDIEKNEKADKDGIINIKAIITGVDSSKKLITAKTIVVESDNDYNQVQKEYALKYTGATDITNAYGTVISALQLQKGEIVEVAYNSIDDKIESITVSKEAFISRNVTDINLSKTDNTISYGNAMYQYNSDTLVFDNGKNISVSELTSEDVVTIRGYGKKICSIVVEKGHGVLELKGYSQFIGGYIEIGDSKVLKVTDNMSIPVTEGTYKVILTKGSLVAVKNITVEKNRTAVAEFDEYFENPKKQGGIEFVLSPENAKLYVDGVKTDTTDIVQLDYGIHTLTVVCNGYDNYIETFVVDSSYEKLVVALDNSAATTTKQTTTAASTTAATTAATNSTTTAKQTTKAATTKHDTEKFTESTSTASVLDRLLN